MMGGYWMHLGQRWRCSVNLCRAAMQVGASAWRDELGNVYCPECKETLEQAKTAIETQPLERETARAQRQWEAELPVDELPPEPKRRKRRKG